MIRDKIRLKPQKLKNLYLVDKSHETHVKELDISQNFALDEPYDYIHKMTSRFKQYQQTILTLQSDN